MIGSSVWLTRSVAPYTTVTIENPMLRYRGTASNPEEVTGLDYQI